MNRLATMFLVACVPCFLSAAAPPTSTERISAASLRRTKIVSPVYPRFALDSRIEGYVVMEFTIQPDGSTTDIVVVDAEPSVIFDESAVYALSQWRYEPVVRDGKAVSQAASIRVKFAL